MHKNHTKLQVFHKPWAVCKNNQFDVKGIREKVNGFEYKIIHLFVYKSTNSWPELKVQHSNGCDVDY